MLDCNVIFDYRLDHELSQCEFLKLRYVIYFQLYIFKIFQLKVVGVEGIQHSKFVGVNKTKIDKVK